MVSQELLVELRTIIKEDYGADLAMQEVSLIANSLVGFFETLAQLESQNEYENFRGSNS